MELKKHRKVNQKPKPQYKKKPGKSFLAHYAFSEISIK